MAQMNMIQALNSAMDVMMARDPSVVVMGEDVGYFGGVFRVTDGLQRKYGEHRVLDSPIAEEWPVGTNRIELVQVAFHQDRLFAIVACPRQHVTVGVAGKRGAPELQLAFDAGPVCCGDEDAGCEDEEDDGQEAEGGADGVLLQTKVCRESLGGFVTSTRLAEGKASSVS